MAGDKFYLKVFDFIEYFFIEIGFLDYNDLFGPTHLELGIIIYVCYFIQKYK